MAKKQPIKQNDDWDQPLEAKVCPIDPALLAECDACQ
jgi:hypothetical protein